MLALAECFENEGRYLPAIEETIRSPLRGEIVALSGPRRRACENFKGKTMEIDLASADLAWQLATANYWLGEKLSPEIRKLIAGRIGAADFHPVHRHGDRRQAVDVVARHARGNHWNAVDLAGVAGSALARDRIARAAGVFRRRRPKNTSKPI